MENHFNFEIIGPEKIIFSDKVKMVTLPSFEGEMGVLKNHISIITFLRPGIIKIEKNDGSFNEFFVQDGTVEYYNDNLVVLSATGQDIKKLSKDFLQNLSKNIEDKLAREDITDQDRYILSHKLDVIREIRV